MDPSFSVFLLSNFDACSGLCACLLVTRRLPPLQASHLNQKQENRSSDEEAFLLLVLRSVVTAGNLLRSHWIWFAQLQLPGQCHTMAAILSPLLSGMEKEEGRACTC